jgi:hypothetical protein
MSEVPAMTDIARSLVDQVRPGILRRHHKQLKKRLREHLTPEIEAILDGMLVTEGGPPVKKQRKEEKI